MECKRFCSGNARLPLGQSSPRRIVVARSSVSLSASSFRPSRRGVTYGWRRDRFNQRRVSVATFEIEQSKPGVV